MTFSLRHFLRQVPSRTLKEYFSRTADKVDDGWWDFDEPKLTNSLTEFVQQLDANARGKIVGEFKRVHILATELGRNALLNAAKCREEIAGTFGALDNDYERALWALVRDPALFQAGEELRFVDYYAEGNRGRSYRAASGIVISRDRTDLDALQSDLQLYFRTKDGSGASCQAEVVDRHGEGSVQVTIYVEGLPDSRNDFDTGHMRRRTLHPAIEAAIVYDPKTGETVTVAKGGKDVHETLRRSFGEKLMKIEPRFDPITPRRFRLDSLRQPRRFATEPDHQIANVRVRKLKLVPPDQGLGAFSIEAPAGMPDVSVYDLANRWFSGGSPLNDSFAVVHATISLHYQPVPGRNHAKVINLQLTVPHSSNLKNLHDADRQLAETYIEKWQLIDPT